MITEKRPYIDINDTLVKLKAQVIDSLDYARNELPTFENPETLFYYLKGRVKYKNDPHGIELLQTLPTMLEGNYYGSPGMGDCDCFVIALLASCWVQGQKWHHLYVTLAGRDKYAPVHIWCGIFWEGDYYDMDLTQPHFNSTREYKYTQELKFNI